LLVPQIPERSEPCQVSNWDDECSPSDSGLGKVACTAGQGLRSRPPTSHSNDRERHSPALIQYLACSLHEIGRVWRWPLCRGFRSIFCRQRRGFSEGNRQTGFSRALALASLLPFFCRESRHAQTRHTRIAFVCLLKTGRFFLTCEFRQMAQC